MKTYYFSDIALSVFIALSIGFMLGNVLGIYEERANKHEEAIQLNHAEYNTTNGHWQWKTNLTVTMEKK